MRPSFFLLLPVLSLCACGILDSPANRALHKSPDFKAGYRDGCTSAAGPGANMRGGDGTARDEAAYAANKAYRAGWSSGYGTCHAGQATGPAAAGRGPVSVPGPGGGAPF